MTEPYAKVVTEREAAESLEWVSKLFAANVRGAEREMNNFKVGERVAAYNSLGRDTGLIVEIIEDNLRISLDDYNGDCDSYHYKQCRKLIKKRKAKHAGSMATGFSGSSTLV